MNRNIILNYDSQNSLRVRYTNDSRKLKDWEWFAENRIMPDPLEKNNNDI